MIEQAAFLTAIAADPGDDVRRLGYADWLDENGDPDRAEFVRVQVELSQYSGTPEIHPPIHKKGFEGCWHCHLEHRSSILLDRHRAEWARLPCPGCGGEGYRHVDGKDEGDHGYTLRCFTCGGTGDLFRFREEDIGSGGPHPWYDQCRTVTFSRGFPESVSCRLDEVVRPGGKATEWAKAVVRAAPVTRFVPTDVVAIQNTHSGMWHIAVPSRIPLAKIGETEQSALNAFFADLGRLVWAEVYGKAVKS